MKTVYADLDEIVFEDRSKDYGAYVMRKRSRQYLSRAALIALLLFLCVTALPKMVSWLIPGPVEEMAPPEIVVEVDLKDLELPPPPEDEPPPEELKAPPPPIKTIEFRIPEPTPEDELEEEETIIEQDSLIENPDLATVDTVSTTEYDWTKVPETKETGVTNIQGEKEIGPTEFVVLEKEPAPTNMDEIKKLIGYPPMAKQMGIEGKVVLRVQVDKNGQYLRHIVNREGHPVLLKAVEEKIKLLTCTPGIQAGKPIKVWLTIPFDFKLVK